jgi:DNA-binding transcriptional regulator YiaG
MSAASTTDAVEAARRRHPSTRSPVSVLGLRHRVADALELGGAPHPEVAATILALRGRTGLDGHDFARRAGVDARLLARVERGEVARDELPGALRRMVPR